MRDQNDKSPIQHRPVENEHDVGDLGDLHEELRILLQGTQVLTAFLILLPFSPGFAKVDNYERWIYLATFLCSVISMILFSAPAAQHRLERPLRDRVRFKQLATRMIIAGMVPFSLALALATLLIVTEVFGPLLGAVISAAVTALILLIWWLWPLARRYRAQSEMSDPTDDLSSY